MPKMDGIAAAAQITGDRIAPVVMLTAFSQRDLIERARDAGAMAYLVKPFEKRDLLPAIEMAVSRFAEITALEKEVTGLRERLEARKLIERAKGALMTAHAMTEPQAFRWIQRAAMDNRTSMRAVAELVLTRRDARIRSDSPRFERCRYRIIARTRRSRTRRVEIWSRRRSSDWDCCIC